MKLKTMTVRESISNREVCNHTKQTINHVKLEIGNTITHEIVKSIVCYIIKEKGNKFLTECKFIAGGRGDCFCLSTQYVYEILMTEKESNLVEKQKRYPFHIVKIMAKKYEKEVNKIYNEIKPLIYDC